MSPFPHTIRDGLFPPDLLAEAAASWPGPEWSGWHAYDDGMQSKQVSDLTAFLPRPYACLLHRMARLDTSDFGLRLVPDLGLWGAGLHQSGPGPGVALHEDADHHPRLGLQRALSAVLYVHPRWEPEWGGELELWHADQSGPAVRIEPLPGRLVVFDVRGTAYHRVAPVTAWGDVRRMSIALFWYGQPVAGTRPRARFVEGRAA